MDCNTAGFGPELDVEPPPPQAAITAAITARHTSADEICNFFMGFFLMITLGPKIWTGSSTENFLLPERELSHFSGELHCEE
jgi:hypothetical protein